MGPHFAVCGGCFGISLGKLPALTPFRSRQRRPRYRSIHRWFNAHFERFALTNPDPRRQVLPFVPILGSSVRADRWACIPDAPSIDEQLSTCTVPCSKQCDKNDARTILRSLVEASRRPAASDVALFALSWRAERNVVDATGPRRPIAGPPAPTAGRAICASFRGESESIACHLPLLDGLPSPATIGITPIVLPKRLCTFAQVREDPLYRNSAGLCIFKR
ncbi:hypothetical protein J2X43_003522 [Rhizobium sp. BE258]|nr:hypothetical protein [Rhizobium sp. BE258]